jgi:hypothetical protein
LPEAVIPADSGLPRWAIQSPPVWAYDGFA